MVKSKSLIIYGISLALLAFAVQWLQSRYALQLFSTEAYVIVLALGFTALGIWVGTHLGGRGGDHPFSRNEAVIESLGLTDREIEVLQAVARGESNAEIAASLFVSTSTIKTHLVHLYQKLEVSRRTQAVQKARALSVIE